MACAKDRRRDVKSSRSSGAFAATIWTLELHDVLATLKARAPLRYGTLLGVIATGEQYGIALPKGSTLRPAVNKALTAMVEDGTIERLQRKWLTTGIDKLPVLR